MSHIQILRIFQVTKCLGVSRSTLYGLIKAGKFKPPILLGSRAVGWLESDVSEFIAARVQAARKGDE